MKYLYGKNFIMLKIKNHATIIDQYNSGLSAVEIGKQHNVTSTTILNILKKYGINPIKGKLQNNVSEICFAYSIENKTIVELSKQFSVNSSSIHRLLLKNKIPIRDSSMRNRKYQVDFNFFEEIDNEEKAYFLGLLYADGCLVKNSNCFFLSLQEQDSYILEQLKECLKYTGPIKTLNYKTKKETYKNQKLLRITNKKIYCDLINLGLFPNKSLSLKFPINNQVPNDLIFHFIRGYFDGDGSVTNSKNKPVVNFLGTFEFLSELKKRFNAEYNFNEIQIRKLKHSNCFSYSVGGKTQLKAVYRLLYKNCTTYLTRKKNKFEQILQIDIK